MKKTLYALLVSACIAPVFCSCNDDDVTEIVLNPDVVKNADDFVDPRDNNVYRCVQIGDQVWMAENLRYCLPLNALDGSYTWGEEIFDAEKIEVTSDLFVEIAQKVFNDPQYGGWPQCDAMFPMLMPMYFEYISAGMMSPNDVLPILESRYPDYYAALNEALKGPDVLAQSTKTHYETAEKENGGYASEYGLLYSYDGALAAVPDGWRLPTDEDWMKLEMSLGLSADEAKKVNSWRGAGLATLLNKGGDSKFNAINAGGCIYSPGPQNDYYNKDDNWYYWTSTKYNENDSTTVAMIRMSAIYTDMVWKGESRLNTGKRDILYSVRCVKDAK